MKRLYEVKIRLYVVADNKDEAKDEATQVSDLDSCDVEVIQAKTVAAEWANSFPFGSEDDRKCKEYLNDPQKE